jgi:rod shape-determining protein MreB
VHLVEEGIAAAIGAGLPVTDARGSMVVDIGGGTTDIAVVALGGMVYNRSVRTAGNHMDEAIIQFMRRQHKLLIGERTAEQVKIEIGSAAKTDEELNMEVRGRCLREGRPKVVVVTEAEIREALAEPLKVIVGSVRTALDGIPPEISADVSDNGIVITGGGALLRGLADRLRGETGVPVTIADDPLTSVVRGVGHMLDNLQLLRRMSDAA